MAQRGAPRATERSGRSVRPGPAADLPARLSAHLDRAGWIRPGDGLLVAVSGGLDSVTLLHLLRFHLACSDLRLAAAHFDHRMRPGSAADARWVAGLCASWAVPVEIGRAASPLRSEAPARSARYRFLRAAARRAGARWILTAHHADDQAETILFRIARGTGLHGLQGIPARRGRLLRPLLPFRRAEIAAYAAAAGLRFRSDPTNLSLSFARNRIRHDVIPRLEAVSPRVVDSLLRLGAHARASEAAWEHVLDSLEHDVILRRDAEIELARPKLLAYHPHVRARLIRRWLRSYGSLPDRAGTTAALKFIKSGASGGRISVAGGVLIEREFDRIRIRPSPRHEQAFAADRPLAIAEPGDGEGEAFLGGRRFSVRWTADVHGGDGDTATFDASAIQFPLTVRAWRPGDRIRLALGSKKLKKLFGERRVAVRDRSRIPVLADARGRVLWIPGVARSAVAGPAPDRPLLQITVRDAGS